MKKTLLILASVALLLTGCANELAEKNVGEERQTVSFTVGVESTATRAAHDNDGNAANIDHWIMQVLDSDGEFYNYQEDDATAGETTHTFDVPLIKGQTYQVLFWADTKGNYEVSDLRNVTRATEVALTANRDDLDAFSAVVEDFSITLATQQTITLKRPFAQLNVVFTDLKKLYDTMDNDTEYEKFKPVEFVAKAKVPTTFNVLTQEAGTPAETALEMTAADNYNDNYAAHQEKATLYMDYILTSKDSKDVLDIDFSFVSKGVAIEHNFTPIPFQRNYRTNIIGDFMSAGAQWTVIVDPNWSGEYDEVYDAEGSVAAANDALQAGKTAIEITNPEDYASPVTMPTQADGKDISIKVAGVSEKTMTFQLAEGAQGPANLYITTDAQRLDINLPNSHVEVNGGTYTDVTAKTGDNTLVVGKDVTVKKLTTTKGAVVVNGLVEEISSNAVAQINISTADGLMAYAAALNAGKYTAHYASLVADIDMAGKEWVSMSGSNSSLRGFDGEGHTISNLTTTTGGGAYYGLFLSASFDIKNVTVKDAVLTYPESAGDQARAGVIVGWLFSGNVTNCHVDGADIKASQKIGGIVGNVEASTANPMTISGCSVKNLTVSSNCGDLVYQAAGIAGYIQQVSPANITVENCSVENIKVNNPYTGSDNKAWHCHSLIGNINNTQEGTVIALVNNTVDAQLPVERTAYTSDYFGWAGNAEAGADKYKATITIDGTTWTPNYPIKNETKGTSYSTLVQAVQAAAAGDVIKITAAGTYKVPSMAKNITIAGAEEVVVFDCVGSGSIASIPNGATFENVTMNFGQNNYHGFQHAGHIVMEECILNGLFFSYGNMTFKGCTFNQEKEEYNMWCYGSDVTYDGCTFNSKGKFLNVYNESGETCFNIVAKDCVFNTTKANKAALNIKETCGQTFLKYNVTIENCSCNDTQNELENCDDGTLYRVSPIWQVDDIKDGDAAITVTVDGKQQFPLSL